MFFNSKFWSSKNYYKRIQRFKVSNFLKPSKNYSFQQLKKTKQNWIVKGPIQADEQHSLFIKRCKETYQIWFSKAQTETLFLQPIFQWHSCTLTSFNTDPSTIQTRCWSCHFSRLDTPQSRSNADGNYREHRPPPHPTRPPNNAFRLYNSNTFLQFSHWTQHVADITTETKAGVSQNSALARDSKNTCFVVGSIAVLQ